MTDQEKAQAVIDIEQNVMPMSRYEWIGDSLVAQSETDGGWVMFDPAGESFPYESEDEARAATIREVR